MHDPVARSERDETKPLSSRLDSLDGKCIGLSINAKAAAEPISMVVKEKLEEEYSDIEFTRCEIPGRDERKLSEIESWAREETDACIAAIAECGGCTRSTVRAANAIETSGTPAVGLVVDAFESAWEMNAESQQRNLRYVTLSIPPDTTDKDTLRERIDSEDVDGVAKSLTEPLSDAEKGLEG